jgi:LmbE family N-acetylglucosaminyl deacetylase
MPPKQAKALAWSPPRGKVLVLAPHADDETIGCGGTLVLHARRGDEVKVVVLTDGAAGDRRGHYRGRDYPALRRAEARRAAGVLGVSSLEFWNLPDGRLEGCRELAPRLRTLLRSEMPAVVYAPSGGDAHPDHKAVSGAVDAAAGSRPPFILSRYEVWAEIRPGGAVDISAVFPTKLAALACYATQLRYVDYAANAARVNAARGLLLADARYAEAFEITKPASASARRGSVSR